MQNVLCMKANLKFKWKLPRFASTFFHHSPTHSVKNPPFMQYYNGKTQSTSVSFCVVLCSGNNIVFAIVVKFEYKLYLLERY